MKFLGHLLISVLAVFLPVKPVVVTVLILILLDLVLGVWAARKRGEAITSSGFRRTVAKVFLYETAVLLAFVVEKYLTGGIIPLSNIVSTFIGLTELKSLLENADEISGQPLLQKIIDKIGNKNG